MVLIREEIRYRRLASGISYVGREGIKGERKDEKEKKRDIGMIRKKGRLLNLILDQRKLTNQILLSVQAVYWYSLL